jgi:hypothetical protein
MLRPSSALYFCYTLTKFQVSWQIFIKVPNIKFHRNLSSWSHAAICRQMDGHDEANSHSSQLSECTEWYSMTFMGSVVVHRVKVLWMIQQNSYTLKHLCWILPKLKKYTHIATMLCLRSLCTFCREQNNKTVNVRIT